MTYDDAYNEAVGDQVAASLRARGYVAYGPAPDVDVEIADPWDDWDDDELQELARIDAEDRAADEHRTRVLAFTLNEEKLREMESSSSKIVRARANEVREFRAHAFRFVAGRQLSPVVTRTRAREARPRGRSASVRRAARTSSSSGDDPHPDEPALGRPPCTITKPARCAGAFAWSRKPTTKGVPMNADTLARVADELMADKAMSGPNYIELLAKS
jgi:hypothetical protein